MDYRCVCLYVLYFWGCSVYAILAPFYPTIAYKKGMDERSVGYLFSLYAFVAFLMSPVNGKIMNKIGRRTVLLAGGITESIGMLIFTFVIDLEGNAFIFFSVVARILMGAGGSALLVTCFAVISNIYPDDMESKVGIMETLGGIGLMAGPPIGGLLYGLAGYKFVFLFYTLIFLVLSIMTYKILPYDNPEDTKVDEKVSYLKLLSIKKIFLTLVVVIFGMAGPGFLEPVLAQNLETGLQLTPFWIGFCFGLITLGYTIAMLLLNKVDKAFDRRMVLFTGLFVEGMSFIIIGPWSVLGSPNIYITCFGLTTLGFGSSWAYIPSLPYLIDSAAESIYDADKEVLSNTLSTIMGTTHYLGETLGPIVGGVSCSFFGYQNGYSFFGVLILLYFGFYGIFNKVFESIIKQEFYLREEARNIIREDATNEKQRSGGPEKYEVIEFVENPSFK